MQTGLSPRFRTYRSTFERFALTPRRAAVAVLVGMLVATTLSAQDPSKQPKVVAPTQRTAAQDAAAAMGKSLSNADIANAIRNSGLSAAEVRNKLRQAGFDPGLADPFFTPGAPAIAVAPPSTVEAMAAIGINMIPDNAPTEGTEGQPALDALDKTVDTTRTTSDPARGPARVFGRDIFASKTTAFDPELTGPVDPGYRLGIGDQLQVLLTGQVEQIYQAQVRPDGNIMWPMVGLTAVAGLSLDAARSALRINASRVFSGLSNGSTRLDLNVTRVRNNQVFIIGDVDRPGSYVVNGLSTVFHAIARAGGPSSTGSFRNIELRRGGQAVRRVDLYEYLIRGEASADVRTEQGDIIFVPAAHRSVTVTGAVRREGIFELRDNEGFKDLLEFAGGLLPTAATNRIQIDRTLPPPLRRPGTDRVVRDVTLGPTLASLDTVALFDSDVVSVFEIGSIRRNSVHISGAVSQQGTYEWQSGITLSDLIAKANGTLPWSVRDRVKVTRTSPNGARTEVFSVSLDEPEGANLALTEFDDVVILDRRDANRLQRVSINGAVRSPTGRAWAENMTLADLVDFANGFLPSAIVDRVFITRTDPATGKQSILSINARDTSALATPLVPLDAVRVPDARVANPLLAIQVSGSVFQAGTKTFAESMNLGDAIDLAGGLRREADFIEVARRMQTREYTDTTAIVRQFTINGAAADSAWRTFALERDDHVIVRTAPGFRPLGIVTVRGSFKYPGAYALTTDEERLVNVIERAGGLLPTGNPRSLRVLRVGRPVPVDFARAQRGSKTDDIILADGDELIIDNNTDIVTVGGAVERAAAVPYRSDWGVRDYIIAAGGYSPVANKKSVIVSYPSGAVRRSGSGWLGLGGEPRIERGSSITIGARVDSEKTDWAQALGMTAQVTTTMMSLIITYLAIKK